MRGVVRLCVLIICLIALWVFIQRAGAPVRPVLFKRIEDIGLDTNALSQAFAASVSASTGQPSQARLDADFNSLANQQFAAVMTRSGIAWTPAVSLQDARERAVRSGGAGFGVTNVAARPIFYTVTSTQAALPRGDGLFFVRES